MKPKIPKSGSKTSSGSLRPKSSPAPKTKRLSNPSTKSKQKSALDHVRRSPAKRRLNTIISERNSALTSLTEIENKYEKLFSVHSDGILIFNAETKLILDANDSACKLFGYSKEELIQLTIPELSAEPEQTLAQLEKVSQEEITNIPKQYKTQIWQQNSNGNNYGGFSNKNQKICFCHIPRYYSANKKSGIHK